VDAVKHDTDRRLIVQYQQNLPLACKNAYAMIADCDRRTAAGESLTEEDEKFLGVARVLAEQFTRDGRRKPKS
jgi:hypothetical protein